MMRNDLINQTDSHRRCQTVDAQFSVGDVARLLNSEFECSMCEYLHNEKDNRLEERRGVSRRGHSDA
jgi:hypothetical protein